VGEWLGVLPPSVEQVHYWIFDDVDIELRWKSVIDIELWGLCAMFVVRSDLVIEILFEFEIDIEMEILFSGFIPTFHSPLVIGLRVDNENMIPG